MSRITKATGLILLTSGALNYNGYLLEDQRLQAEYLSSQAKITQESRQEARKHAQINTSYTPLDTFIQFGVMGLGALLTAHPKRNNQD